jgi:DNA repair protein RecO (recombination protein O)
MEVYHKASRDMQLVKEVSRTVPLNSLPYDITKSTQAIFMAEILYRVVKEEEPNPMLTQFLLNTIQYMDALEEPITDFHIIFMFHLSRYLGFYPQNNFSESNKYFDLLSGQFKPHVADPDYQLDEMVSALWSRYIGMDYGEAEQAGFNSTQRKIMLDSLIRFYRNHVAGMGEIKSLEVLHAYFHNL